MKKSKNMGGESFPGKVSESLKKKPEPESSGASVSCSYCHGSGKIKYLNKDKSVNEQACPSCQEENT